MAGSLSGIVTTALLLYDENPSLLGVMAVTTPLTILVTEALEHLTNRWRQAQRETEQYLPRNSLVVLNCLSSGEQHFEPVSE